MLIKDILMLLTEYNSSKTFTTLAGKGGEKATGKNYDNIITGKAQPYKQNEYETKYGKLYPALNELVKKLKSNAIKGDIIITGPALANLQELLKTFNPKQTKEGDFALPFGDNIRVKSRGSALFLHYNDPKENSVLSNDINDISGLTK